MALTRAFLRSMQLSDEQISAIIEEHTASTDALKAQRDQYKASADQLESVQQELESIKVADWEQKYTAIKGEFDAYKNDIAAQAEKSAKESAYKALLVSSGIGEKYIDSVMRVSDLSSVALDDDGAIIDADKLTESIKTDYSAFVTEIIETGAPVATPPATGSAGVTKEQFAKMGYNDRLAIYNESPELYETLTNGG